VQILGKENVDAGNAIADCFYSLNDGRSIRVRADGDQVLSIWLENLKGTGRPVQVIYALNKTWDN
jgi:hypothetical protein